MCPEAFPERSAVPQEHEIAAAKKRESIITTMNPQASRDHRARQQEKALAEFEAMTRDKAEAREAAEAASAPEKAEEGAA